METTAAFRVLGWGYVGVSPEGGLWRPEGQTVAVLWGSSREIFIQTTRIKILSVSNSRALDIKPNAR